MLRAAIVGVGFMGWIHYLAYQRSQRVQLMAFSTRDPQKRAGDWRGIQGNFGPPGELIALKDLKACATLDQILDDPEIDLVDICLPPHLHVSAVCQALRAGKHVLCEKPLALTAVDCDQIVAAADQAQRRVFVAQVLPYMGQFQFAYQIAQSGQLGAPKRAYLKRIISPPTWIPDFYDPDRVGGPLIDLHVHDTHFVRLVFGMPSRVICSAEMQSGRVKFAQSLMEFEQPGLSVSASCGVSDQTARPFCHGFEIEFERGAMQFELAVLPDGVDSMPLRILGHDGSIETPEMPASDEISAFTAEIDDVADSLATDRCEPRLDVHHARDAILICERLQQSAESGGWVSC